VKRLVGINHVALEVGDGSLRPSGQLPHIARLHEAIAKRVYV